MKMYDCYHESVVETQRGTENVRLGVEDVFREWLEAHLQLLFRAFLYPGDRAIRYKHEGVDICVHTQAYIHND